MMKYLFTLSLLLLAQPGFAADRAAVSQQIDLQQGRASVLVVALPPTDAAEAPQEQEARRHLQSAQQALLEARTQLTRYDENRAQRAVETARIRLDLVQALVSGRAQRDQYPQLQKQLDDSQQQLQAVKSAISQRDQPAQAAP